MDTLPDQQQALEISRARVNHQGRLLALHMILFLLIGLNISGGVFWAIIVCGHALWFYYVVQAEATHRKAIITEKPKHSTDEAIYVLGDDGELIPADSHNLLDDRDSHTQAPLKND